MTHTIHPVILCGGSGTRLWPLSTPERPKQFLALTSEQSMIAETAARFDASTGPELAFAQPLVVGAEKHEKLLQQALPIASMILEPMGRNSAPAVAAACLAKGSEDLVLILPADHDIQDVPAFHRAIEIAAHAAEGGAIVTFGIEPTHPATGYGYIKSSPGNSTEASAVEAFVEKPDLQTAQAYLAEGSFYWNAGIFLFKAETMLQALSDFAPGVLAGTRSAMSDKAEHNCIRLNAEAFSETPSISIDYAVMEKATNVKTVPVSMGWSDVGGYRALHELLTDSPSDNHTNGPVIVENSEGLYVRSEGPVVTVNGVSNLVIVATQNEVMITPMEDDAAVKTLGAAAQSLQPPLGISQELRTQAKDWLWTAFATWSRVGWDERRGGFVEQLHMDGTPDADAARRVRVQARQVFSFAKALNMGWPNTEAAERLVAQGIDYIDTRLRHADGGFVHLINPDGSVIDDRRDLYDHAFMILAGSAAYKATGNQTALNIANDALAYIDTHLKDHEHGGWFESSQFELPRRANPHMHLLEAMMEYHDATGDMSALDRAAEVVCLFETKFFNPATNVMGELFEQDWSPTSPESEVIWEPGHHYEWATLLHFYEQITGHDSASWRRRLNRKADSIGINPTTRFAANQLKADGTVLKPNSRLWHQLERFRSRLLHQTEHAPDQNSTLARDIFDRYLGRGPAGGWVDEVGTDGNAVSEKVPASMLYHAITSLREII